MLYPAVVASDNPSQGLPADEAPEAATETMDRMDKRDFLKTTGMALGSAMLFGFASAEDTARPAADRTNWSGNYTYRAPRFLAPASIAEVQQAVRATSKLRALGTRHSFNAIADSSVEQISLHNLQSISLDAAARTVTLGSGVPYGVLDPWLDSRGFALPNLASLPQISVAGGISTATHGSGLHNRNLSSAVVALQFVAASGELVTLSREKNPDVFPGAVVALGALGILTSLTLRVEPTYQVAQVVYQDLPFAELEHNLETIFGSGYSVSLFTDWQHGRVTQAWIKRKVEPGKPYAWPDEFYYATRATHKLHPAGQDPNPCTEQLGIPGPWYERLPHFRMGFTPSTGHELQTEYHVPLEHGYQAIRAVESLRDRITPHLFVIELRTIAPDDLWMSMSYRREALAIHFTWKPEWPAVRALLPQIEAKLAPFAPRPHWAKLFTMPPAVLQSHYEKLADFKQLLAQYDPDGKFRNEFLQENLYA